MRPVRRGRGRVQCARHGGGPQPLRNGRQLLWRTGQHCLRGRSEGYQRANERLGKRMQLGDSGLSVLDITQFLMRCDLPTLADFGSPLISQPVAPSFVILDNLLTEAEYELVHTDPRVAQRYDHGWSEGPPEQAEPGAEEEPSFSPLDRFLADLEGLRDTDDRASLANFVPSGDWAESAWRLSMLALAESDEVPEDSAAEGGDPTLQQVVERAPFRVEVFGIGDSQDGVEQPFVGEISAGRVALLSADAP